MAIIYSYPIVDPSANDLVLGSDFDSAGKPTKNFTVQSIIDLVTVTGNDLQAVLDNGNTANSKDIDLTNNNFRGGGFITTGNASVSGTTGTGFTSITSTAFVGTLSTAAQPNVTSLGTLTSLAVNTSVTGTAVVTTLSAPGDNLKIASTKAIVDYIGTNPPGAESLSATLLVGNTTGATKIEVDNTGSGIDFIDDAKARFGTGDDLEIFHNGSHSFIKNVGTGELRIPTSMFRVTKANDSATLLEAQDAGAVKLYFANNEKLATTNTGVSITGNTVTTGAGTFVNLINSGTYSDSSGDVGSAGQILSSTGSGTNWINDPNPTPYTWIIEADSGAGSPYTVANGDTIDFVGVGNVDTAWDNSSKELRISLGGTSISGTGADTQVVYWTGAQTVSGDAGMVYNDTSNNLTVSGTVQAGTLSDGTFSGTAGTYTGGVSITSTTFVGALTGNASTATALASAGTIQLLAGSGATQGVGSNAVTYTNGGNVQLTTTLADTTVTAKALTNLPTPTSSAIAASDTILAAMAKLQGQITATNGLAYEGTWDPGNSATAGGTPDLRLAGNKVNGHFYICSAAGVGTPNGNGTTPNSWAIGDWVIYVANGSASDEWQKLDQTNEITGSGATNKIAKWTGTNTLGTGLIEDNGTTVTIGNSGDLHVEGDLDIDLTSNFDGVATFQSKTNMKQGIEVNGAAGSAGQVLTSGAGAAAVMSWTTPTTGTVTSVATNNGLTGGTITTTGTLGILTTGTSNAIEFLSAATPASGDLVWFSDINDSNTLRKCTVADLQGPIGGPFLPLAGGTMTGNTLHGDNVKSRYGTGNDLEIYHDSSNSYIATTSTSVGDLRISQEKSGSSIVFFADLGGASADEYFRVDGSNQEVRFSQSTRHLDNVIGFFGSSDDLRIVHNATNSLITNKTGNIIITTEEDDSDIIFKSDDGSGGTATYLTIDGGDENIQFSKNAKFLDGIKGLFGNSNDLQIYHDGNSYISNNTGVLYIDQNPTDGNVIFRNDDGSGGLAEYIVLDGGSGAVKLKHYGSQKFETTSGGVSVTGSLSVSTTSSLVGDVSIGDTNSAFIGMLRAGANYIAATNAAGTLIFRTGGTTPAITIDANQNIKFDDYGSGNNTGTATYNLEVDANGNVIETPSSGGGGGVFHGDQAITTGSAALTFTLKRATTGTLIFDVWFTSETSTATSVAKKYVVAHSSNTAPVYNKILDTGPDGSNDFTVTFANATTTATGDSVTCSIQASGINQNIGYTVQVGYDSANALTFTAAS